MTYSLIEVFSEMVKEYFQPYLKSQGFRKQHLHFYKVENGLIFMIHFQKSVYNSIDYVSFYINCGIYSAAINRTIGEPTLPNPKHYECLYRQRFERITGYEKQSFELIVSDAKTRVANSVLSELKKVIDFYATIQSDDDLIDICLEQGTLLGDHLLTYLAIKKDLKRIEKYVARYDNLFKGDARRQRFEDGINAILKKHHIEVIQFSNIENNEKTN